VDSALQPPSDSAKIVHIDIDPIKERTHLYIPPRKCSEPTAPPPANHARLDTAKLDVAES
jgi:hypothetical protein